MKKILSICLIMAGASLLHAQKIPAYSADRLMQRISNKDTVYIVNFWASWCGPCVKELPEFDQIQNTFAGQPVKVLLVSFDFKDSYPEKLATYVERKKILPEVVWFSQTNANDFIPKIDNNWSGGIPATMVVNARTKYHIFMEKPITAAEVEKIIAEARK